MPTTIPQNTELINNLKGLLKAQRTAFGHDWAYEQVVKLVLGEVMVFGQHTLTQLIMVLGANGEGGSGWHRLFSRGRFAV